jgi:hypothetical protein
MHLRWGLVVSLAIVLAMLALRAICCSKVKTCLA